MHDTPPLKIDPDQIQQVFLNLILNARDAMPDGGSLDISVKQSDGHVEMLFADTGRGIDAEVKDKVFDPFFSTKGPTKGTGLGLSHLLQHHQGPRRHDRDRFRKGQGNAVYHQNAGGGVGLDPQCDTDKLKFRTQLPR